MPSIFKALASIVAWILFVSGCLALISRAVVWLTVTGFTGTDTSQLAMDFFVVIALLVASVVVMKLRQMLE
jgi:hypothetical protein